MKTFMIALGVCLMIPACLLAQSDVDALRYSQLTFGGSARFMGLSGAFGALGADFGSLSENPAGIGLYRNSEFSITPALTGIHTTSDYLGNSSTGQAYPFNIGSGGVIFSSDLTRRHADSKWKRLNFGFGANRTNDYNSQVYFSGFNNSNSLTDYYVEQANQGSGVSPANITNTYAFGAGLFYQAYLINPDPSDTSFYTSAISGGNVQQSGVINTQGASTEYLFSLGSNYDDRLLLGMTIGIPSIHYSSTTSFSESDDQNLQSDFNSFTMQEYKQTDGNGFNAKFGASYVINDVLRVGAAIHTPTYYWMHDSYNASIGSNLNSVGDRTWNSPDGSYNYDLITPWRGIASIAAFIKSYGFISLDYEFVDYSAMNFQFKRFASTEEQSIASTLNQTIDQKYGAASNIRLGAEFAYDLFRLRAGVAHYGSPFQDGIATGDNDFSSLSYSAGAGIHGNKVYFDVAYVHTSSNQYYQPYTLTNQTVQGVAIDKTNNNILATLGVKF